MTEYKTQQLDHLGIVAGMCDKIELVKQIDAFFPGQQRKVSVGEAVKAMILNALGFVSRPLYLTPEFYEKKPIELLFRPGLCANDFNEDSLGRALDALFEQGVTPIFAQVSSHALAIFGIKHQFFHMDTTSFSFYGEYKTSQPIEKTEENKAEEKKEGEEQEETKQIPVEIVRGYSKDQHPDLKQVVCSLICSYRSTLPMWLEVLDGNSSDHTSFPQTIESFLKNLEGNESVCFIVDSALYSEENIQRLSGTNWLTRVPETLSLAKKLVNTTKETEFQPTKDENYKVLETEKEYGGIKQRWILVHSEQAKKRETKSFEKKLEKEEEKVKTEFNRLQRKRFHCKEDAEKEWKKAEKKWAYYEGQNIQFEEVHHYQKKGRPKAGAQADEIMWKITGDLKTKEGAIAEAKAVLGRFIIGTNMPKERLSTQEALDNYKAQGSSVERGFRFLKDPLFFANGMYLQKPSRIMALMMVMTLSLLVFSLAETELRKQLQEHNDSVPDQKGKPTQHITMRRVFQMFEGIHVLIESGPIPNMYVLNLNPHHRKIIHYLGHEVQKCYRVT